MAKLYGITTEEGGGEAAPQLPAWLALWGKSKKRGDSYHPLIAHMIDVGMVARAMWERSFTPALRARVAGWLGLEEAEAGRLLAFWIALHDLGKATPAFQAKVESMITPLQEMGFPFGETARSASRGFAHGKATAALLPPFLERLFPDLDRGTKRSLRKIAKVLGGHHGSWPAPSREPQATAADEPAWQQAREALVETVYRLFRPPSHFTFPQRVEARNGFWTFLSGYTSTADWLGSMERYFPFVGAPLDVDAYAREAREKAERVLEANDWTRWFPPESAMGFLELFHVERPRPMQEVVIALSERLAVQDRPALVILEAPTGSGKTEAALYLADRLIAERGMRGFYVAMPTMATSNQMYERVQAVLERRYGNAARPLLLHSQARWTKDDQFHELNIWEDQPAAMSWFLRRRRGLLAPFAVGTVDQALLAVLKTKHFFVRHFGLSGKVLIFDEVHAYDTYMSTLFERLLRWLRELGATVIILSATLPQATRRKLLTTYADEGATSIPDQPAPALSWVTAGGVPQCRSLPVPEGRKRHVVLQTIEDETLERQLREALREGGCVAVLRNTVRQAQETYRRLREARIVPDEALYLFHARYPMWRREEIEEEILHRFGKRGDRPQKAIVVATQVIEQSLDLDFDLMVSDVAPIDLLIQRVGRLHRHRRPRPAPLREPRLLLIRPREGEDGPDFGHNTYIYARYTLLQTWNLVRRRTHLDLPDEAAALVEQVYGETPPADDALLQAAYEAMLKSRREEQATARQYLIADVTSGFLLNMRNDQLRDDDDPKVHSSLKALTRLSPPSVQVACLYRQPDGTINTRPDGNGSVVDLQKSPDQAGTASTYTLARTLLALPQWLDPEKVVEVPKGWRQHPLLRYVYPLVFEQGELVLGDYRLTWDYDFGLNWGKLQEI